MLSGCFLHHEGCVRHMDGRCSKHEKFSPLYLHAHIAIYAFLHMDGKKNDKKRFSNFIQSDIMERRWKQKSETTASEYEKIAVMRLTRRRNL